MDSEGNINQLNFDNKNIYFAQYEKPNKVKKRDSFSLSFWNFWTIQEGGKAKEKICKTQCKFYNIYLL